MKYYKANIQTSTENDRSNNTYDYAEVLLYALQRLPYHHKDNAGVCIEWEDSVRLTLVTTWTDNPEHSCSQVCMSRQFNGLCKLVISQLWPQAAILHRSSHSQQRQHGLRLGRNNSGGRV